MFKFAQIEGYAFLQGRIMAKLQKNEQANEIEKILVQKSFPEMGVAAIIIHVYKM